MKIYMIDDDNIELAMWELVLSSDNEVASYKLFNKADSLKEEFNKEVPDCCIVDLVMPNENGIDVCDWIRDKYPTVKLFINSYLTGDEYDVLASFHKSTILHKNTSMIKRLEAVHNGCKS